MMSAENRTVASEARTTAHAARVQNLIRKTAAAGCAVVLAGSMIPTTAFAQSTRSSDYGAAEKTEVVYVKASDSGKQTGVYVVNQFQSDTATEVHDAGTYTSTKNLADEQELNASGTSTIKVGANQTYLYQGNLDASTETPWNVTITYKLDGKTVKASELAGKSGDVEMTLSVKPNDSCKNSYADNYLLQISSSFDNDLAWDIDAEDATSAQATGSTQVSYMLFPGKSAEYTVKAHVSDFEFDGWQLVGVPLSIALDIDDNEFGSLTEDLDKLEDAGKELNDGAQELASGSTTLANSSKTLASSTGTLAGSSKTLADSTGTLVSSTTTLADSAKSLAAGGATIGDGLNALSANGSSLISGVTQLQDGILGQSAQLGSAAGQVDVASAQAAYSQAAQSYTAAFAGAFAQAFMSAYQQYVAAGASPEEAQQRAQADAAQVASQATAGDYASLEQALTELVTAQATKSGYESASTALAQVAPNCDPLKDGITSYVAAASQLAHGATEWNAGASQLASGASELSGGAGKLASGANQLSDGAGQLASGANQLSSGAGTFANGAGTLAGGTQELQDQTTGISGKMIDAVRDKLTEYLNPSFTLHDFANDSTEGIENVQFVYKTDAIEIPDDDEEEAEPEDNRTFFEKLLALFGM